MSKKKHGGRRPGAGTKKIYGDRKAILVYLEPGLVAGLESLAEKDELSRNQLIAKALTQYAKLRKAL